MSKKENINEITSMLYCCNESEIEDIVTIMRSMPHASRIGLIRELINKGSDSD